MELKQLFEILVEEGFYKGVFSQPQSKSYDYQKTIVQLIQDTSTYFQFESFTMEQAFHKNINQENLLEKLIETASFYKQLQLFTKQNERIIRISNKGKIHVTTHPNKQTVVVKTHNTKKNHLLPDGEPVDFLIHLGIMESNGKVKPKWYDKFRQINRYLELIDDSLKHLDTSEPTIIDFGCGKSYLTFALYHYLNHVKKMNATIIGLDLKEKVIENLNKLTLELGFSKLEFKVGDIALFNYEKSIDMVISLHACNLATDYAIEKAIKWNAKVIMAVPCCHKEVNQQIDIKAMETVFSFGVLKERIAALMTDGLRAELMRSKGYDVQVLEFVDMEHTPKNLMIRGFKKSVSIDPLKQSIESVNIDPLKQNKEPELSESYLNCVKQYSLEPTLEKLLYGDIYKR